MLIGQVREITPQDIRIVKNLIEMCIQLYMSEKEVVDKLSNNAKIQPRIIKLVWQRLELENLEYFKAYHMRVALKAQINRFNHLLERQVEVMRQVGPGIISTSSSNGSQMHSTWAVHNNSGYQVQQPLGPPIMPENMHHVVALPSVYANGASALQPTVQLPVNMSGHCGRIEMPKNKSLTHTNSNSGIVQGMNHLMIESEGIHDSRGMFGTKKNKVEKGKKYSYRPY